MQVLEDRDVEDATNVEDFFEIENKELELDCQRAQTTEYLTQDPGTRSNLQDKIAAEMESPHATLMLLC